MGFEYVDYEKKGPNLFGVRFVPLTISLKRRWEMFNFMFLFMISVGLVPCFPLLVGLSIYSLIYTNFVRYVVILYLCWYVYDRDTPVNGGRRSFWLRRLFRTSRKYYPAELVKTVDLPATNNYLFGTFPHGIICQGVCMNFLIDVQFNELFPQLRCCVVALDTFFKIPILRETFLLSGVSASNRENIMNLLTSKEKNKAVVIVVGGAFESTLTQYGANSVFIDGRKGFIKLAFQTGSALVPVYTFGENEVLNQYQGEQVAKYMNIIRKFTGIPPLLIHGRGIFQYTFGLLPRRRPLTTVVGKPIPVPKIDNPTDDQICEYHNKFKEGLIELFESNKEKYDMNGKNAQLVCL